MLGRFFRISLACAFIKSALPQNVEAEWWRCLDKAAVNGWRKRGPRGAERLVLGRFFRTSLACALSESAPPQNVTRKESRMVALHRRGSSQCVVKGESKGSGTAFDWAVLFHLIGVRFDSGAPHAPSPLRGTSHSLLSKTATSLRCFSARGAGVEEG